MKWVSSKATLICLWRVASSGHLKEISRTRTRGFLVSERVEENHYESNNQFYDNKWLPKSALIFGCLYLECNNFRMTRYKILFIFLCKTEVFHRKSLPDLKKCLTLSLESDLKIVKIIRFVLEVMFYPFSL